MYVNHFQALIGSFSVVAYMCGLCVRECDNPFALSWLDMDGKKMLILQRTEILNTTKLDNRSFSNCLFSLISYNYMEVVHVVFIVSLGCIKVNKAKL